MSSKLSKKTVAELKLIAAEKGINVEGLKKADIVDALERDQGLDDDGILLRKPVEADEVEEDVIVYDPKQGKSDSPHPNMVSGAENAMVSAGAGYENTVKKPKQAPRIPSDKIALWFGNSAKTRFGKFKSGYNFVPREVAVNLLRYPFVREASPKEVAKFYGVEK